MVGDEVGACELGVRELGMVLLWVWVCCSGVVSVHIGT